MPANEAVGELKTVPVMAVRDAVAHNAVDAST